jgi:predicted tellurium resistance membrane protein TerC
VILWEYLKQMWSDPLYQAAPAITLFALPLATTALILRRRSAVAQSPLIYACFAAMVVLWWGVTARFYGAFFMTWQYLTMGAAAFLMLVGVTILVARFRRGASTTLPSSGVLKHQGSKIDDVAAAQTTPARSTL